MTGTTRTVAEAAVILKVNADTVRRMVKRGDLRASKVGKHYLIADDDIDDLLHATQTRPPARRRRRRAA